VKRSLLKELIRSHRGFSLIEILIALTLLAIAGTFVAGKIFEQLEEGKTNAAKIQLQALEGRLKEFRRHCNFYPTSDQGLEALINKPSGGRECKRYLSGGYLEGGEVPVDPWEQPYVYESDGKKINISSGGPDETPGTEDDIFLHEGSKPSGGTGGDEGASEAAPESTEEAPSEPQDG
jgi:general secretion pathway protein G